MVKKLECGNHCVHHCFVDHISLMVVTIMFFTFIGIVLEEKEEDSGGEGTRMMVTMMTGMVMGMRKMKPGSPR